MVVLFTLLSRVLLEDTYNTQVDIFLVVAQCKAAHCVVSASTLHCVYMQNSHFAGCTLSSTANQFKHAILQLFCLLIQNENLLRNLFDILKFSRI